MTPPSSEHSSRIPRVSRAEGCLLAALFAFGCSGSRPFGDLPEVSINLPEEQTARPRVDAAPPPVEAPAEAEPVTDAPDPPALRQKEQLDLELAFDKGEVKLVSSRKILETQEVLTPRKMGRFAVELYLGAELVERVRFDFPLLADDASASFEYGLQTRVTVRVPDATRATRALVLDRKTRKVLALPWPLPEEAGASSDPSAAEPGASGPSAPRGATP